MDVEKNGQYFNDHYAGVLESTTQYTILDSSSNNLQNFSLSTQRPSLERPDYIFWYVTLVNIILFVVGVSGNILVLLVIIKHKEMRTHMNYLLSSLCLADLLVLVICQPAGMVEFYGKDRWYLGEVMCKVVPLLENASLNSSVLTLWVISCERYNAICRSLKRNKCEVAKHSGKCVLLIWMFAHLLSLPFFFMTYLESAQFFDGTTVNVCRTKIKEIWHYIYVTAMTVVFFLLPLIVLIFMYSAIIRKIFLTRSPTENPPSRQRKQAIMMIIGVVALFFVSLLPIRIVTLWRVYAPVAEQANLGFVAYTNLISVARIMMNLNSAGNPIIYGLVSSRFRIAFRKTVCLTKCCGPTEKDIPTIPAESLISRNNIRVYKFTVVKQPLALTRSNGSTIGTQL